MRLGADQGVAAHIRLAPQRTVGLQDPFRQCEQHAQRVFGHGVGVAAGLVDHQHAGFAAGLDIDGIIAGAIA